MTDILILPVNTAVRRLPEEVLAHISEKHGKHREESFAAYEALFRLSLSFHFSKSNCRLPYIEYDQQGRPYFPEFPSVSFSLSHTDGMAAAVMSDEEDVGIDIERICPEKLDSYRLIAQSRFFACEQQMILENRGSAWEEIKSFLSIWTLKEAAAKVLQKPVLSLNSTAFSPDITFTTAIHDENYVVSVVRKKRI